MQDRGESYGLGLEEKKQQEHMEFITMGTTM